MWAARKTVLCLALTVGLVVALAPTRAWATPPGNDLIAGATAISSLPLSESLQYAEATHSG